MSDLLEAFAGATAVIDKAVAEADIIGVDEAQVRVEHHLVGLAPGAVPPLPLILLDIATNGSLRTPAVHEHVLVVVLSQVAVMLVRDPLARVS